MKKLVCLLVLSRKGENNWGVGSRCMHEGQECVGDVGAGWLHASVLLGPTCEVKSWEQTGLCWPCSREKAYAGPSGEMAKWSLLAWACVALGLLNGIEWACKKSYWARALGPKK